MNQMKQMLLLIYAKLDFIYRVLTRKLEIQMAVIDDLTAQVAKNTFEAGGSLGHAWCRGRQARGRRGGQYTSSGSQALVIPRPS